MKKRISLFFACFVSLLSGFAQQNLIIYPQDLRLEYADGAEFANATGFHLYIRKKAGLESVMLVETTKDPEGKVENFAYRAREYNPINGDEIRLLDGKKLDSPTARFSLIDSTAEADAQFGEAFHIFIPSEIEYGYAWDRNGIVKIDRGTFINIRAFEKPYADYTGEFLDNPYMFDLGAPVLPEPPAVVVETPAAAAPAEEPPAPVPPPKRERAPILTDDYSPIAADSFKDIAGFGGGKMVYSRPENLVDDIMDSLERIDPKKEVDVVFAIDSTGSMKDDIEQLRNEWVPRLIAKLPEFGDIRIGLLLYRDYGDTYKYMNLPVKFYNFTSDVNQFTKHLNGFVIHGSEGGDVPEAVYEALWGSMEFYKWRPHATRKVILIGDAEPHPRPQGSGKYTKELVAKTAAVKKIAIDTIIVPDDKSRRGR